MKFPIVLPEEQAIRKRFGGEIQQIERKFETDKVEAERRFGGLLTHELGKNKRLVYGGTAAAAVAIFGGSILTMIKTAVAIGAWGFLLAAMIIFGVVAWRKLPRYELELANRERERILKHLLPRRYALSGEAQVFPVCIEIRFPGGAA